jgi:hypothetical protein
LASHVAIGIFDILLILHDGVAALAGLQAGAAAAAAQTDTG